jgi:hypothetical protein
MFEHNERASDPAPSLETYQERVRAFLQHEAVFAQVVTVNQRDEPAARTMVAPPEPNWSVYLVQRKTHRRITQWRLNPATEIIWVGTPHRDNRNLRPHVYDWCVQVPRVVFLRGSARFLEDDELVATYQRQSRRNTDAGRTLAPVRDRREVLEELVGVCIHPRQVRAEGFGPGPESYTWVVETP